MQFRVKYGQHLPLALCFRCPIFILWYHIFAPCNSATSWITSCICAEAALHCYLLSIMKLSVHRGRECSAFKQKERRDSIYPWLMLVPLTPTDNSHQLCHRCYTHLWPQKHQIYSQQRCSYSTISWIIDLQKQDCRSVCLGHKTEIVIVVVSCDYFSIVRLL